MNKKLLYGICSIGLLAVLGWVLCQSTFNGTVNDIASTTPVLNESQNNVVYQNNIYGFSVLLPESWRGYVVSEQNKNSYIEIRLAHPQSNMQNPRMDVPVLVVPIATWNTWYPPNTPESGQHPFAAPVPAMERARNSKYVFATAPRYNFSYLPGWEEVDEIVKKITALALFSTETQEIVSEKSFIFKENRQGFPPAKIYQGSQIVEGEYSESYPETLGGGRVHFKIDEQYKTKMPKKYGEYSQYFIFDNDLEAKKMLKIDDSVFNDKSVCELSGRAKIAIKDYTVELQESEVSDHTNLVQVISSSPQVTKTCNYR